MTSVVNTVVVHALLFALLTDFLLFPKHQMFTLFSLFHYSDVFVVSNKLSFVNFTGKKAKYAGRYRITDSDSLDAAMEAAGRIRLTIEAKLSPGPPMLNLRRHGVNGRWHEISDNVASGNFLGAKVSTIMLVLYCIFSFIYM